MHCYKPTFRARESCFFDLAAAINARLAETGGAGDVKDTYSYILAALTHVRYFITEDKDLRRLYAYLTQIQSKGYYEIQKEIRRVRDVFETMSNSSESIFPIGKILERLFWGQIPTPVSILDAKNAIAEVLTKTETMLALGRSLARIDSALASMQSGNIEIPNWFNGKATDAARTRIESVATAVGVDAKNLTVDTFRAALVEKESAWTEDATDKELINTLGIYLEWFQEYLYVEEEEDYASLEDRYRAEELTKIFLVKCEECETKSEVETEYEGVVETEQRAMGTEYTHLWAGDADCPHCKNGLHVEYTRYEYPMGWMNFDDLEADGCEILEKPPPDKSQRTIDSFELVNSPRTLP